MQRRIPEGVTVDDVLGQLNKILLTPAFRRSPRPSQMLTIAVEHVIAGTPWTQPVVAKEVFGREVFQRDRDTIVRATANKVRKLLADYNQSFGLHDLLYFNMPVGGYTVTIERRTVELDKLLGVLRSSCPPEEEAIALLRIADYRPAIAIDKSFEIHHSHLYKGWTKEECQFTFLPEAVKLPADLEELVVSYPVNPPNNGKYRLFRFVSDSSERPFLGITLVPTDYFSTRRIQILFHQPVLKDAEGRSCTPVEKYAANLLDFEHCQLPNIVCMHIIVVLPGDRLLLTQRVRWRGVDWEAGKWSPAIEEQMSSSSAVRPPDRDFFDTVRAGVEEELGCSASESPDIKILSITTDSNSLVINTIALVHVPIGVEAIRAHWQFQARDGKAEIRGVTDVEWSLDALIPALAGDDLNLKDVTIKVSDWGLASSRMRVAVALFHKYGLESTLLALSNYQLAKKKR